jgi:hypothetical protein
MGSEWAAMILGVDTKKLLHFRRLKRLLKLVWSPFSIPLCAIYTLKFTCVSQTSGTIRHAFPRTSGQEGSIFLGGKTL